MIGAKIILILIFLGSATCTQNVSMSPADILPSYDPQFMARCYFPAEFQGEFVMQVSGSGARGSSNTIEPIQYSPLNITYDAIPVWGYCHKRVGDNVLLVDRIGDGQCIRCFRLKRRSRNIIEVFYENLNRCYTYEKGALESCETLNSTAILYRTKELGGIPIRNEFCPIAGRYHFKYNINDGTEDDMECNTFSSSLDNCPDGSIFRLQFKKCSFQIHGTTNSVMENRTTALVDRNITFNCLGSWPGRPDGARYIALLDTRVDGERRPQYRCGLYHVDNKGRIYMAFSSDSSCTQNLENSTSGYETLILTRAINQRRMPDYVTTHLASYPKWAQGEWEESLIVNGTMSFNDLNGYRSYTFITVDSNDETGRYIVYSKDHCEQEAYLCLMMRQRSENVLEFKIGTVSSPVYARYLCDDLNLDRADWMTQARLERLVESPCPITGHYVGRIPDLPGTCAELSSNCNTREIMYYKVTDCESGELYEERTYLCLGQWEEKGVMYTYTKRNDTETNECFVGLIVNDDEIYIKEAGDHCLRNIDPRREGMRLHKKGQCYGNSPSPAPTPIKPIPHDPIMRITTPHSRQPSNSLATTKKPPRTISSSASQKFAHVHIFAYMSVIYMIYTKISLINFA
ncbi:uncharacterized protein [Chelonus insularis]|uniref:uncharacterized protein n=1 Tax=Chelonus insularis TaxID=460826 RepID=UPI00158D20AA|nr:uncharacterized protein LOC118064641 [Chelonus insularis]XP_034935273.1 uncharacterized protein LOC118064641 [Chelonus insularis]